MRGFTLVEMMVALLIFSLITAAGVVIIRFTTGNQDVVAAREARLAQFARMRAILKSDLSEAAPRRTRDAAGQPQRDVFAANAGGRALLAFVRAGWENPDAAPRSSLQRVEYRLVDKRLERQAYQALDGGPAYPAQVLMDGVDAIRLSVLWQDLWRDVMPAGQGLLPQAVRLEMTIEGMGPVTQLFLVTGAQS